MTCFLNLSHDRRCFHTLSIVWTLSETLEHYEKLPESLKGIETLPDTLSQGGFQKLLSSDIAGKEHLECVLDGSQRKCLSMEVRNASSHDVSSITSTQNQGESQLHLTWSPHDTCLNDSIQEDDGQMQKQSDMSPAQYTTRAELAKLSHTQFNHPRQEEMCSKARRLGPKIVSYILHVLHTYNTWAVSQSKYHQDKLLFRLERREHRHPRCSISKPSRMLPRDQQSARCTVCRNR